MNLTPTSLKTPRRKEFKKGMKPSPNLNPLPSFASLRDSSSTLVVA